MPIAIPIELMQNRSVIEGNFVMTLWKQPEYFFDYEINSDIDLLTDDGKFYYSLGFNMVKKGHKVLDELSILTFLNDNSDMQEAYELRGGYKQIHEYIKVIDVQNIEAYFDDLCKSNLLIQLNKFGFDIIGNLQKFQSMKAQDVKDYWEYVLESLNIKNTNSGIKIEDLIITDQELEDWDKGIDMGINYGKYCPILNYITLGIPLENLYMVAGYSGLGKTSFILRCMALPAIDEGNNVCIISNEQKSKEFKRLLLAMTLADKFGYYQVTRKKLKQGGFLNANKNQVQQAKQYIKEQYEGKLKFVKLFDYNVNKVKSIVKKLAKEDFTLFIYDTMKGENLVDGQIWQELIENSKDLFQLANKESIAFVPTYQLAPHTVNKRFLDVSCLSNAKQLKEVFSEMILMRQLWDDEYDGEKHDIKPYNLKKDEVTGRWDRSYFRLDRNKKYIIVFVEKTRNDEGQKQVLYEFNGEWNRWIEVGYCTVINDHIA